MNYKGGSIGRALYFLHEYCPNHVAEHLMFGRDAEIFLDGSLFATMIWDEAGNPTFTFLADHPSQGTNAFYRMQVQMQRRAQLIAALG